MRVQTAYSACAAMLPSMLTATTAAAQLAPLSIENLPERRGEIGCSIIESKVLPDGLKEPLFWHIHRVDSPERAAQQLDPQASQSSPRELVAHDG